VKRIKARYVVALVVCVGAIVWMVTSLSTNLNYMEPVSAAVRDRASQGTDTLRIGGVVKPGSIDRSARTGAIFALTDGDTTVQVHLSSEPPSLFSECTPVVVQGRWKGQTFVGDSVLVRHGSTYDSKKHSVGDVVDKAGCPQPKGA
jgi:cytochrome c-type biogenesis protein CcmE